MRPVTQKILIYLLIQSIYTFRVLLSEVVVLFVAILFAFLNRSLKSFIHFHQAPDDVHDILNLPTG